MPAFPRVGLAELSTLSVPCRVIPPTRRMRCMHFGCVGLTRIGFRSVYGERKWVLCTPAQGGRLVHHWTN